MSEIHIGKPINEKLIRCCSCRKKYDFKGNIFKHKKDNVLICPHCGLKHKVDFKLFGNRIDTLKRVNRLDLGIINIGVTPINRAASFAPLTIINKHGAANATGTITEVKLWAKTTLVDCEVAIFYRPDPDGFPNNFTTRDTHYIGGVVYGAVRTFAVNLAVQAGDYIGLWFTTGAIERDYSGFDGCWYTGGDKIPCTNHTFTFLAGDVISLSGIGATAEPPDPPTNVQATDGVYSNAVQITWTKSDGATGYQVYRDGTPLGWLGDVALHNDFGADAPTITHGSVTASDGIFTAHIALANTGASANNGTTHTYKVKARNAAGESGYSGTNTGYIGHGTLTYQWWRSNVDGDSGYGSISGATSSTYNDTAAPAGSVPGTPTGLAATDGVHTDKVALTWANVSGGAGAGRYYKCYHTATGAVSGYTGANRGYRKAYTSTNTQVKRDITELGAIGSLATSYNDFGADAPTITVGTASASDGTSSEHVTLSIAGESANVGTTHDYYVRTYNAAGWGNWCGTNTGYRGVGSLTYQWQRSATDSDANYSNIDGGTTDPYNDTEAPENGDGRYYKCIENATGAAQQTTNADRGYRLKQLFVSLFGIISFIGNVGRIKLVYKFVSGIITFIGNVGIVKTFYKTLSGIISFIGNVDKIKTLYKVLSGVVSFVGSVDIVKSILQYLSGTLTFIGNVSTELILMTRLALSGTLTFVGNLGISGIFYKAIAGTLVHVGSVKKGMFKSLFGTVSFVGSVKKGMFKSLFGIVSFVGNVGVEMTELLRLILSGALTFIGNLEKRQELRKSLTGIIVFVGSIETIKMLYKSLTGIVSFVGDLIAVRIFYKIIVGTITFVGNVDIIGLILQSLSGSLTFIGNLGIKQTLKKVIAGVLTFTGNLKKGFLYTQFISGVLGFTGLVGRIKKYAWILISKIKGDWDRVDKEKEDSTLINKEKGDFTRVEKEKEDFTKVEKEKEDWKRVKK